MINTILRPCTALLLVAAPVVAQTATDEARIQVAVENGAFQMQSPSNLSPWSALRFRLSGKNTEWARLVIDCDITNDPSGRYTWLQPKSTMSLGTIGDGAGNFWNYQGPPSVPNIFRERVGHELHLGVREYGTENWSSAAVSDWFVPFHIGRKSRVWASTAYWWEADQSGSGGLGLGPNNAAWWDGLNQHHYDGSSPDVEKFSLDALFRRYVLFRAAMTVNEHGRDPFVVANEFFNDASMFTQHSSSAHFRIHVYGVMLADPDAIPGLSEDDAPRFDQIPIGRITNGVILPIILPKFFTKALSPSDFPGLAGTLTPGELRYFEGAGLMPPVRVRFQTDAGPQVVEAKAAMTRNQPLRMKVRVPTSVTTGLIDVKVQDSPWFNAGTADHVIDPK